jgi:hypothetical protein
MGYCPVLDKYCWLNGVLSWLGQVLLRTLLKDLLKGPPDACLEMHLYLDLNVERPVVPVL